MELSKSALKKAAQDFDGGHRYKRLLSISAAERSRTVGVDLAQRRAKCNLNNPDLEAGHDLKSEENSSLEDNFQAEGGCDSFSLKIMILADDCDVVISRSSIDHSAFSATVSRSQ